MTAFASEYALSLVIWLPIAGGVLVLAPVSMSTIEIRDYSTDLWGRDIRTLYNINRGDAGALFPGSTNKREFDNSTNPSSAGQIAVCAISDSGNPMTANVFTSSGRCNGPNCSL